MRRGGLRLDPELKPEAPAQERLITPSVTEHTVRQPPNSQLRAHEAKLE